MQHAEVARQSLNQDFWPARSLVSWRAEPQETFATWLAQQRVLGRQFRDSSRETYAAIFSWWVAHLEAKGLHLLEASTSDAGEFFKSAPLEAVSRRRYLQLLDRVYRHLLAIGWAGSNPLSAELAKEGQLDLPLPPGLDVEDLLRFTEVLEALPGWKGHRDRCAAALMAGAGLRANELIQLPMGAVGEFFDVKVTPEGVHRAHVTLVLPDGPWRLWVRKWEAERTAMGMPGTLFCPASRKGEPYSPSGLFRRVSAWLSGFSGLPQSGPNLLRNTFARQALGCGRYAAEEVQEFLGHEELRATARHFAAVVEPSLQPNTLVLD